MVKLEALGPRHINGVNSASKWCTRIGVGASIASGFLSYWTYSQIENPTWGDKAQLTVGITSSVLSAIPYTTYLGVGIGMYDVIGGFNNWYGAWNNAETMYKTAGVTILPITLPGTSIPLIINKNR